MSNNDNVSMEDCSGCESSTLHVNIGKIPKSVVYDEVEDEVDWIEILVCSECGGVIPNRITEEDVNEALDRYVDVLVENDLIDEEEREEYRL